jgi:hypothetical protein
LSGSRTAALAEHWDVLQDKATKAESKSGLPMFGDCLNQLFHPSTSIDRDLGEALHKLGNEESDAAFVRPSALT